MPKVWGRRLASIFIGGGTPSLFSPETIEQLLAAIRARLPFTTECEITLEANPGTANVDRFSEFRQAGVNRLSLGVQSFDDQQLKNLGRIHNSREAFRAIEAAFAAGFDNINLDLMYGLPNQTITAAHADIKTACSLQTTHLSWYQLTLEPNTLFYQQPPPLPQDEILWDMQESQQIVLAQEGFTQYEVSAYTKNNQMCLHNLNYWQFGDYLGIGAGAHGKITDVARGEIHRTIKHKQPKRYLDATTPIVMENKIIEPVQIPFEFMLNALRLKQNLSKKLFVERTGLPLDVIDIALQKAEQFGFITQNETIIETTPHGWNFLNDLIALFLPYDPP